MIAALLGGDRQRLFQPATCGPANDLSRLQIDDGSEVQLALVDKIARCGPGMLTVGGALEATFLPRDKAVLAPKADNAMSPDAINIIYSVTTHARAAIAVVRHCKRRADMGQIYHVLPLTTIGRAVAPGKETALADA